MRFSYVCYFRVLQDNPAFSKEINQARFYYVDKFVLLSSGNGLYMYKYHVDLQKEAIKRCIYLFLFLSIFFFFFSFSFLRSSILPSFLFLFCLSLSLLSLFTYFFRLSFLVLSFFLFSSAIDEQSLLC